MSNDLKPMGSEKAPTHTSTAAKVGLITLGLGLGGFLLWASFAPLDEGVPSQGMITLDTKSKAVQHLTGGVVQAVMVKEGDLVKEGQTLLKLDPSAAQANYQSVRQRYLGLRAMQSRLMAEQAGLSKITFHPDLLEASTDTVIANQMQTQLQLFNARRTGLMADLQSMEENMAGQRALLQSYAAMIKSRQQQQALLKEERDQTAGLVKEGYAPRNRLLELDRQLADVQANLADLNGNVERAQRAVADLSQRKVSRQSEFRKETESQLSEVTREVQADAEKLDAVKADLARTEIKAPAAGQVMGLAMQTVGGVVQPGQHLMSVVPEGEPLLLETHIAPHLIDQVKTGLVTDVRFSAFAHAPQLVVQGQVESVSHDLLTDPKTGVPYFLARVQITPEGMKTLGSRRLLPGMPAEVVIKTGERSLLTYLMHPLTKRMAASMKEE